MKFAFVLVIVAVVLAGCVSESTTQSSNASIGTASIADCTDNTTDVCALPVDGVEKVEVIHFHGTNQCYSCVTVGDYAEETVKTHFADELASGKMTFTHVNGELRENAVLVSKYGATGSSIWIGVYDETGFHAEQNINVWYKLNNKKTFIEYLKGVLEEKLEG